MGDSGLKFTGQQRIIGWRKVARENPRTFVESKLRIPDVMGNEVKFQYNWAQRTFSAIKQEINQAGIPLRLWGGKWRRAGISSSESAEDFSTSFGKDFAKMGILAHQEERAEQILANYMYFYELLRTYSPELMAKLQKKNISGIKWERGAGQVLVGSAENPVKIRGDGLQSVHISEGAHFFNKFIKVMEEVCPVVPPLPGSKIVIESTGTLMGSAPYEHYYDAVTLADWRNGKRGRNEFIRVFLCWLDSPDERIPVKDAREFAELCELIKFSEPRLAEKNAYYKLTPEQIKTSWRMYHYQSKNDFDYFTREFPYAESEMWSAGGASFYGAFELGKAIPEPPIAIYVLDPENLNRVFEDFSELRRVDQVDPYANRPHIKVFEMPKHGRKYCMGSDHSLGDATSDYSAASLRDRTTRAQMLTYHGRLRPDEAAHLNVSIGRIYNKALMAPETNPAGGGAEVLNYMQRLGYHNIYIWRIRDGILGVEASQKLGWWTHSRSRPMMLSHHRQLFLDSVNGRLGPEFKGIFRDIDQLREMRTFGTNPETGIPEANVNCYDDRVMADAICNQVCDDEVYCTKDDLLHAIHKFDDKKREPITQQELMTRVLTPEKAMAQFLNPNSNFNRNKWEI